MYLGCRSTVIEVHLGRSGPSLQFGHSKLRRSVCLVTEIQCIQSVFLIRGAALFASLVPKKPFLVGRLLLHMLTG